MTFDEWIAWAMFLVPFVAGCWIVYVVAGSNGNLDAPGFTKYKDNNDPR